MYGLYVYEVETVTISSATFVSNVKPLIIAAESSIEIADSYVYNNSVVNTVIGHVVALNIIGAHNFVHGRVKIELSNCNFDHNFGGSSTVYVNIHAQTRAYGSMILENSTFSNNKGTALYLTAFDVLFKGYISFINNLADDGAAVYMDIVVSVSFEDDSNVQFINNSADQRGGAIYINLVSLNTDFHPYCDVFNISNTSNVSFTNNSAGIAGNSMYFSIPNSCQIITNVSNKSSLLYYPSMFKYSQPVFTINPPVVIILNCIHLLLLYNPVVEEAGKSWGDSSLSQSYLIATYK